jgi:hypothetical protein
MLRRTRPVAAADRRSVAAYGRTHNSEPAVRFCQQQSARFGSTPRQERLHLARSVPRLRVCDLQSLSRFPMDTLMRLPGVTAVRSSVCPDEIKCTSALPVPI